MSPPGYMAPAAAWTGSTSIHPCDGGSLHLAWTGGTSRLSGGESRMRAARSRAGGIPDSPPGRRRCVLPAAELRSTIGSP